MLVLITGATGFVGSHLVDHLLATTDWEVVGLSRSLRHATELKTPSSRLTVWTADLTEPASIDHAVEEIRPDGVIHLAGQPLEPLSWKDPGATFRLNLIGQLNLFEAIVKTGRRPPVVIGGSALMYGLVEEGDNPVNESQPLRPASPYAVSKLAADYLGYQYFVSHQLPVIRMRPFNQVGPRQSPDFAIPAFARQIAEIESGRREAVLRVGNLSAVRDFMDVRDAAVAYRLALGSGQPGEAYNLGSGQGRTIEFMLQRLLDLSSLPIRVETDPARLRPVDLPRIVCDASKFSAQTNWKPSISIETSLADTLDYWRRQVGAT